MRILTAHHGGLHLVEIEDLLADSAEVTCVVDRFSYGITQTSEGIVVAHSEANPKTRYEDKLYGMEEGEIVIYDEDFSPLRSFDENLYDLHQIDSAAGVIFICNTGMNGLTVVDDTGRRDFIIGDADPSEPLEDLNHINSVHAAFLPPFAISLTYVFHNFDRPSEIVQGTFLPRSREILRHGSVELPHNGVHNVLVDLDDGVIYYCASQDGALAKLDIKSKKSFELPIGESQGKMPAIDIDGTEMEDTNIFVGWHTKGLAEVGDYLLVGCSEHIQRVGRFDSHAKLVVVDKKNFSVVNEFELGQRGNLNEIHVLP